MTLSIDRSQTQVPPGLLEKLRELAPGRITKAVFGNGWDVTLGNTCIALRENPNNPVDEASIISACFQEAKHRGWRFGCSHDGNEYGTVYFARCEMDNDSEVTAESTNHAVATLEALTKALELQRNMDEDFVEWG